MRSSMDLDYLIPHGDGNLGTHYGLALKVGLVVLNVEPKCICSPPC